MFWNTQSLKMDVDLLRPVEIHTHKLKKLIQAPNSFFMDVFQDIEFRVVEADPVVEEAAALWII